MENVEDLGRKDLNTKPTESTYEETFHVPGKDNEDYCYIPSYDARGDWISFTAPEIKRWIVWRDQLDRVQATWSSLVCRTHTWLFAVST